MEKATFCSVEIRSVVQMRSVKAVKKCTFGQSEFGSAMTFCWLLWRWMLCKRIIVMYTPIRPKPSLQSVLHA